MQQTTPLQPPPDLALLLLSITTEAMRIIVRDLIVPLLALGVTLATLQREPTLPRLEKAAAAPVAPLALPPSTAPALECCTVAQLRQLARAAGHKALARSGRRQQLLEVLA